MLQPMIVSSGSGGGTIEPQVIYKASVTDEAVGTRNISVTKDKIYQIIYQSGTASKNLTINNNSADLIEEYITPAVTWSGNYVYEHIAIAKANQTTLSFSTAGYGLLLLQLT